MQKIKNWFEDDAANSGEHYDFLEYEGHLEVRTETAIFMVVEPHSGTNRKWMLRISTMRAFDRWANSTPIELFFDSDVKLCNYLHDNQLNIYKRLLKYLSEEYDDILDSYEEDKEWYEENLKKSSRCQCFGRRKRRKKKEKENKLWKLIIGSRLSRYISQKMRKTCKLLLLGIMIVSHIVKHLLIEMMEIGTGH